MTGPQIDKRPTVLAEEAAETVRALNHALLPSGVSLTCPADVYDVLGSLRALIDRFPLLCGQLATYLLAQLDTGWLTADAGLPYEGDPGAAVTAAGQALADGGAESWNLACALDRAQQAVAGLARQDASHGADGTGVVS